MAGAGEEEKSMEEELTYPIMIAEEIRKSVEEAESFKVECTEVGKQIDRLSQMLRTLVRLSTSTPLLYERPVRRIVSEVSRNLDRALTLVRKCKRSGLFNRILTITITSVTDFRKLFNLLESSIGDMKWLLNVFDSTDSTASNGGGGIILSLAPIAANDPILSWVWSYIAAIQMGPLFDRIEAANQLATLAFDNARNQKIIVEEGGVSPLLKLLKEGSSPDAQIAAANALCSLGTDQERVRTIVSDMGIPIIVQVLSGSPMRVQIEVANLVSIMAKNDPAAQEEFAREKVIRPLVSFLSFETFVDEQQPNPIPPPPQSGNNNKPTTLHSLVKINKELGGGNVKNSYPHSSFSSSLYSDGGGGGGSSRGGNTRKERENEKPEVKLKLKINCAKALWMLSKGSVSNSQRITETKGLLCLARIIEKEQGELQFNCLMTLMEIAAAAESNADLRRAAFKTNSPAAKAVVEQLLRIIREESSPSLQIPSIIAIGLLARTFTARETRVISILVAHLSHKNVDVATEAAVALGKFACPENFLCVEHSKTIIECDGITPLMLLLKCTEHALQHGLILLCYLALNVGSSEALERARALSALEGVARSPISQQPPLRELIPKAYYQLELYHEGLNSHRQAYAT